MAVWVRLPLIYAFFSCATLFAGTTPLVIATGGSCSEAGLSGPADDTAPPPSDPRDRVFYPSDTKRVKPLARKLLRNILLDQKEIWTSPFHINRHNAGWWALGVAGTASFIAADRPLSRQLDNLKGQVLAGNRVSKLGATYTVIPVAAGFYLAGVFTDNAKARETGVLGTEAMLDSLIVSSVLKTTLRRNRPNATRGAGDFFRRRQ